MTTTVGLSSMMRKAIAVAGATVLLVTLAGCSGSSETDSVTEAVPEVTTSAASLGTSPAEPGALPEFFSTCEDTAGDGSGGADVVHVDLSNDGSLVFMTFKLAEQVQPSDFGQISFLTTAFSADGESGYQFGSKFLDGEEIANFVFDFATATQENVRNGAVFADGQVSVRYPVAELEALGSEFHWYSVVSLEGQDVDFCGGPGEDAIPVP